MPDNATSAHILNYAIEAAQKEQPNKIKSFETDGSTRVQSSADFFQDLSDSFVKNNVLSRGASDLTHASAFALRVLHSIDATKKIQKNIEEFFSDENNKNWLADQGITTDEEKNKLKEDLKKQVENKLSVQPKTRAGKDFVEKMNQAYDEFADLEQEDKFLQVGCAYLHTSNQFVSNPYFGDNGLYFANMVWENKGNDIAEYSETITKPLHDSLNNEASELTQEIVSELNTELVQHYGVYFGDSIDVKPVDFLEHAKTGEFTLEEKLWANERYQSLVEQGIFSSVDMKDFMVNGKPMFSEEDIKKTSMDELACKLVENMLKGEDVAIKKPGRDQPVHVDVQLIEVENREKKGYLQRFFDFIKDLLNPGAKEMAAQKQQALADNLQHKKEVNKAVRQRISFEELSGKNTAAKLMPPSKDKQLSTEHKLEKGGMSAGH